MYGAQGDRLTALTPSQIAVNNSKAAMQDSHGNLYDAQGNFLSGPKTDLTNAQTGLATAQTGLANAKTQVQLNGVLPLLNAKTDYQKWLPQYDQQKIAATYAGFDAHQQIAAANLAGRINIANASDATRMAIAGMVQQRIADGQSEQEAFKGALAQYNMEGNIYRTQLTGNALDASRGKPGANVNPQAPQPFQYAPPTVNVNIPPVPYLNPGNPGQPLTSQRTTSSLYNQNPKPPVSNIGADLQYAKDAISKGAPAAQVVGVFAKTHGISTTQASAILGVGGPSPGQAPFNLPGVFPQLTNPGSP
jgi:hypothetical protein